MTPRSLVRIVEERDEDGNQVARVVLSLPGYITLYLWPEQASEIGHALVRAAREASDLEDERSIERDGNDAEGA